MTFTPYGKLSKKERSALNKQKRVLWDCKPVTKFVPSKKVYNRKRKEIFE